MQQYDDAVRASAWVDGAIAVAGGGVFATNRIDDAFAVVDVGAPDVDVTFENRPIGRTNGGGRLLIPDLTAYHSNQIAIDPKNLPVDAAIGSTRTLVVPADGSGVVVDFHVKEDAKSAIVAFVDGAGKPLDAGLQGKLEGSGEPFIIGYDGEAYIQGLLARNNASVEFADGKSCRAQFPYEAKRETQISIRNVVCQ